VSRSFISIKKKGFKIDYFKYYTLILGSIMYPHGNQLT